MEIFLPYIKDYDIIENTNEKCICIIGVQHTDNSKLNLKDKNVFISVENLSVGRKHYDFFNKYGRDNPKVHLYFFNDISHPNIDKKYIPNVYMRIKYFNKIYNDYNSVRESIKFKDKQFCLFTSRNLLNSNKKYIINAISKIGNIDFLDKYEDTLRDKTCYNDIELLRIYNRYKFIICFENSKTPGYVTEKIFNVFLSGSIPIYDGAPNINEYIHSCSMIQLDEKTIPKIELLNNNEKTKYLDFTLIEKMINSLSN